MFNGVCFYKILVCPQCGRNAYITDSDIAAGYPVCAVCNIPMREEYRTDGQILCIPEGEPHGQ